MVEEMENKDRQLLLKFMCGRSRLEPGSKQRIDFKNDRDMGENARLPIGHTCGNSMDMPRYETLEIMTKKVLIAIRLCGEIDGDEGYMEEYGGYGGEYGSETERGLNTAAINMHEKFSGSQRAPKEM